MASTKLDAGDAIGGGCAIGAIILSGAALTGWIWNIVKLVASASDPVSLVTLLRLIGIPFLPLGCVIGWF